MGNLTESRVREIVREEITERFKLSESQKLAMEGLRRIASFEVPEREPSASLARSIASLEEQASRSDSILNPRGSACELEQGHLTDKTIRRTQTADADSSEAL